MPAYQYRKLNGADIRLLELLPGRFDDPLEAVIKHVPLSEPVKAETKMLSREELQSTLPEGWKVRQTLDGRYIFSDPFQTTWKHPDSAFEETLYAGFAGDCTPDPECMYEAFSYVWGTDESEVCLYIENTGDHTQKRLLPLRENLETALRHLRYRDKPRTVWVDALCINQRDVAERNEQVHRMGSIYRTASRVVVWLGEAASESRLAMNAMQYLGQQVEYTIDGWFLQHPKAAEKEWFHRNASLPYNENVWTALEKLFERAWFERLWVVQEIALGNRHSVIQCGHVVVPWPLFRKAVRVLSSKPLPSKLLKWRLNNAKSLTIGHTRSAMQLLLTARERKCLDPRDKIYSQVSIAYRDLGSLIKPNYLLQPHAIFKDVFLSSLSLSRRLAWLHYASGEGSSMIPSWLPDWMVAPKHKMLRFHFFASGLSRSEYEYLEPDKLRVTGVLAEVIGSVEPSFNGDLEHLSRTLKRLLDRISKDTSHVTREYTTKAFIDTVTFGKNDETFPEGGYPRIGMWKPYLFAAPVLEARTEWTTVFVTNLNGNRFFQTSSGYYAVGPPGVQKGDKVVVLLGCSSPSILRPTARDSQEYTLVGECYSHGLMFGEAVLGPLPDQHSAHVIWFSNEVWDHAIRNERGHVVEDPRLGPIDEHWERIPPEWSKRDTEAGPNWYRNRLTGVEINCDPRMLPDALLARGVPLTTFTLV
jgi:hypothetical protein